MILLFVFGKISSGSPVYSYYTRLDNASDIPANCPKYPNQPDQLHFGYTDAQLIDEACKTYIGASAKKTVLTYAFNTFCFMNLFNLINCRKVGASDKNVFERFSHNWTFLGVFFGTFVAHIALVQYCPVLLSTVSISKGEWGGAIAVGASVLAIGLVLKLTPESWVSRIPVDRFGVDEDQELSKVAPGGARADQLVNSYTAGMTGEVDVAKL